MTMASRCAMTPESTKTGELSDYSYDPMIRPQLCTHSRRREAPQFPPGHGRMDRSITSTVFSTTSRLCPPSWLISADSRATCTPASLRMTVPDGFQGADLPDTVMLDIATLAVVSRSRTEPAQARDIQGKTSVGVRFSFPPCASANIGGTHWIDVEIIDCEDKLVPAECARP